MLKSYPPAYSHLDELEQEAYQKRSQAEDSLPLDGTFPPETRELYRQHRALRTRYDRAFTEVFMKETAKGHFDIFHALESVEPFNSRVFHKRLEASPLKNEILTQAFTLSPSPKALVQLTDLYNALHPMINPSATSALIESCRGLLAWEPPPGAPRRTMGFSLLAKLMLGQGPTKEQREAIFSLLYEYRASIAPLSLEDFLRSKVQKDKSLALLDAEQVSFALSSLEFPATMLGLDAPPLAVKLFNPSFFAEQAASQGLDPAVLTLLLESWEGTFGSLLQSGASLSAD